MGKKNQRQVYITDEVYDLLVAESMRRKQSKSKQWAMINIVSELVTKELGKE